jgi:hypothetical protein
LFSWLPSVWDHEVDQIIWGRRVLVLLQTSSWVALWLIGRKLLDSLSALVGLAALLSVTYCIMHGIEFRYDTLITSLAILSCAINLLTRHRIGLVISGAVFSVALLSSPKAALFAMPVLITLIVSPDQDRSLKQTLRRLFYFGSGFSSGYLLFGGYHLWSAAKTVAGIEVKGVASTAVSMTERMFFTDARFPVFRAFRDTLQHDRVAWTLFISGIVLSSAGIYYCHGKERRRKLILFSLAIPFLVLPFYRNAYSYFYNTILPGLSVGAAAFLAPGQAEPRQRTREALKVIGALGLIFFFTIEAREMHLLNSSDRVAHVREVISGVKEVFPEPTDYVDRSAMITSYPKVGPFMTKLNMKRNRETEFLWARKFLEEGGVRFLINNVAALDLSQGRTRILEDDRSFRRADVDVFKDNFVHHWGPLWVLGKKLNFGAAREEQTAEFLVPGTYTLNTGNPVTLGDRSLRPWDTIQLEKGKHTFVASSPGEVVFKWGDNLKLPRKEAPSGPLFDGFVMVPRP